MDDGWVKLHRSVMESQVWADDWLYRLFNWCIMKANYEDAKVFGIVVKKGQFITGKITASEELGVTPSKWFRGIEKLAELGCIIKDANRERTTITVCNYETYQADARKPRTASEPQAEPERTASEPQAEPREERNNSIIKEGKKERSISKAKAFDTDEALKTLLVWWNSLYAKQLVPCGVSEDEPSKAVLEAWKRAKATSDLKSLLQDKLAIEAEIKASSFCRESWFRLEKLLSGKNKDREWILKKLLDGGYRDRSRKLFNPDDPRGNMATVQSYLEELENGTRL